MNEAPETARPFLPRGVRLSHDKARERWLLLAPERIIEIDDVALAVLRLCDGRLDIAGMAEELARSYTADRLEILADIRAMLGDLAAKGFVAL